MDRKTDVNRPDQAGQKPYVEYGHGYYGHDAHKFQTQTTGRPAGRPPSPQASKVCQAKVTSPHRDRQAGVAMPPPASATAPQNAQFITPRFPQAPMTVTRSNSLRALMLEKAFQTLEALLGPLLEAVICEYRTMGLSTLAPEAAVATAAGASGQELGLQGLPPPPYSAASCIDILLSHEALRLSRFPITMGKRLKVASEAVAKLQHAPDTLDQTTVLEAHHAIQHIIQDCARAMEHHLLGHGSRPYMDFINQIRPEFQKRISYMDELMEQCQKLPSRCAS